MRIQTSFARTEMKFLLSEQQLKTMEDLMKEKCQWDAYPISTISSIYYDTPDCRLVRRSIEKPMYKEKLRLRVYGTPNENSAAFVEIKKKYDSVVYKRRTALNITDAMAWLAGNTSHRDSQIEREITQFLSFYGDLRPTAMIAYDRDSFLSKDDCDLRVTFDKNPRARITDLTLLAGDYGRLLLPDGQAIMEVKSHTGLPLWLTKALSENRIYKTGFSKYGAAYSTMILPRTFGRRLTDGNAAAAYDKNFTNGGRIYA
ncbi:MAG: polyphosphate polymerase domain-containing protein [Clostridia bacterium]|nr:polyphosphate polymerase domain-containing protein [Clostridia bacterium]